jgi:predicted nucleic acid-binding protein
MSAEVFVDSNVLVYVFDRREPRKQATATAWVDALWKSGDGAVSTQVLQEFYNVATRKLGQPLPRTEAREVVRRLMVWEVVNVDPDVIEAAFTVEDRYGLAWWDALIVAAAQKANCRLLLSEDLQHGQDYGGLKVANFTLVQPDDPLR